MTTAQVVETSVTNNSLSKGYPHPEDHDKPIILLLLRLTLKSTDSFFMGDLLPEDLFLACTPCKVTACQEKKTCDPSGRSGFVNLSWLGGWRGLQRC